jgi:uncharacterized protein
MPPLFSITGRSFELRWSRHRGADESPAALWKPPGQLRVSQAGMEPIDVNRHSPPEYDFGVAADATSLGPRLTEETTYQIYLRQLGEDRVALRHDDPVLLKGLQREADGTWHGTINFRSDIGFSTFTIEVGGDQVAEFVVEVFPTKLDYESDYRQILADVQDIATGLALEYLRSTYQLGRAVGGAPSDLEWFLLLRAVFDDLREALTFIANRPRRGLDREQRLVRAERVRRIDNALRRGIRQRRGSGPSVLTSDGLEVRRKLWSQTSRPTLDTPEHRWLASRVRSIRQRVGRLANALAVPVGDELPERRQRAVDELRMIEDRASRLETLEPLEAAEGEPPPGFTSQQLLSAPGYRDAYQACSLLSAGLRVDGGAFSLSTKGLHELYEYWCYLTVIRLIAKYTGQPIDPADLFTLTTTGLRVRLRRGSESQVRIEAPNHRVTIRFNPTFADASSILVAQRPDIVITYEQEGWPELHLILDAKYRIDSSREHVERYGSPGPPDDAINVLHRYRDAILERSESQAELPKRVVVQAAAVFPSQDKLGQEHVQSRYWDMLERIGVGAIPALPEATEYLERWIEQSVELGGWSLADGTIRHRATDQLDHWRMAAREVAILVQRNREDVSTVSLPWENRPEQLSAAWIAWLDKGDDASTLRMVSPVRSVSIRRGPDGLHVKYEPGGSRELLSGAISGSGFPTYTSRLALERARTPAELYLRNEADWRLRDRLIQLGVYRGVVAPTASDETDHPWLQAAAETRARYAGAAGFEVSDDRGNVRFVTSLADIEDIISARVPGISGSREGL